MFGGERFVPIIGHISLARDMKAALQEADEAEEESKPVQRDAKGREILSPEEKARREEKARKAAAEVRPRSRYGRVEEYRRTSRKRLQGQNVSTSSWRTSSASSGFSRSRRRVSMTPRSVRATGRYVRWRRSACFFLTCSLERTDSSLKGLEEGILRC